MRSKSELRTKRKQRIRKNISGTAEVPRLSVYRSNSHVYAQLVDDVNNKTLAGFGDYKIDKGNRQEKAKQVGTEIAKLAKKAGVTKVVFDRNGYKYHGRVEALAQGAREGGLEF